MKANEFGIYDETPVETHYVRDVPILVKREDLCCPLPGPAFSKIRGVVAHIGVLDTFHSKAGWAVAYVCSKLGKKAVDYWPRYKGDGGFRPQQTAAAHFGAELTSLPAGRSSILYHRAVKDLQARHPGAYMMPNALKLAESVTENAAEAERTRFALPPTAVLVISISSGTVAAGVLRGLKWLVQSKAYFVVLHLGYARSTEAAKEYIQRHCGYSLDSAHFMFVDEGYEYADASGVEVPFPCNPFYDAKAWNYLVEDNGAERLARMRGGPILFWNIGS
jgi:hypothetical protein